MTIEALPITKKVEIIGRKKFAPVALDANNKIFEVYIVTLADLTIMSFYSFRKVQVNLLTII